MKQKIPPSEVTPEELYNSRRQFMKSTLQVTAASLFVTSCNKKSSSLADITATTATIGVPQGNSLTDELGNALTDYQNIIEYTNFYEFATSKIGPAKLTKNFKTDPWSIQVGGLINNPQTFDLDSIRKEFAQEERIYRMRCVEGWSMVIPWLGFPLHKLLNIVGPKSDAKFVRFETIFDSDQMPGQKSPIYPWPYVEGLRMDEAMHDLTILATGIYGKDLTPQNGAPIRLVVPWKYGFKSIKSLVKIDLVETMPVSLWMAVRPDEYGFYANVNPNVHHPRWSQSTERRIGGSDRVNSMLLNGYQDEVASLYQGMDLTVNY